MSTEGRPQPARRSRWRVLPRLIQRRLGPVLIYSVVILFLLALMTGIYRGGMHMAGLEAKEITATELPQALLLSFLRMAASYAVALVFALIMGLTAARNAVGERIIIPLLDILQSIPVLGFFPAAITFFIAITNGHRMGIELAACFLIFTSQAWNMAFAVYEAVKGIPQDNLDAVNGLGLRGSQLLWKLYIPVCIPRLTYNSILSWANGWYFLTACEIITVRPAHFELPGIGSFLARAAEHDQIGYILWGLAGLTALILSLDFLIWRPLSVWAEKFKQQEDSIDEPRVFEYPSLPKTLAAKLRDFQEPLFNVLHWCTIPFVWLVRDVLSKIFWDFPLLLIEWAGIGEQRRVQEVGTRVGRLSVYVILGFIGVISIYYLAQVLAPPYPPMIKEIPLALLVSTGRLIVALAICLAWMIPLVIYVWDRPQLRRAFTTVAQIGAGLPAVALFPLFIVVAVQKLGGGMEVASILLLLTGMQWYLLFNCLGGAATIPTGMVEAAKSFGLKKTQIWGKIVIPAIRPALVTGALTAWGGGWNALFIAEYVSFKSEVMTVTGIGAVFSRAAYEQGDNRAIMICIVAMVAWILLINVIFWRPVYRYALDRFKMD